MTVPAIVFGCFDSYFTSYDPNRLAEMCGMDDFQAYTPRTWGGAGYVELEDIGAAWVSSQIRTVCRVIEKRLGEVEHVIVLGCNHLQCGGYAQKMASEGIVDDEVAESRRLLAGIQGPFSQAVFTASQSVGPALHLYTAVLRPDGASGGQAPIKYGVYNG